MSTLAFRVKNFSSILAASVGLMVLLLPSTALASVTCADGTTKSRARECVNVNNPDGTITYTCTDGTPKTLGQGAAGDPTALTTACGASGYDGVPGTGPNYGSCAQHSFFGFKPWYYYLKQNPNPLGGCDIEMSTPQASLRILAAVLEGLLKLVGVIAFIMIIKAGFDLVMSAGEPEKYNKARGTIINALIGVVISLIGGTVVAFIAARFSSGGTP